MTRTLAFSRRKAILGLGSALVSGGLVGGCSSQGRARDNSAARSDLYLCAGCEVANERDPATLGSRTMLAGLDEPGERLIVRGTVYRPDGVTPAPEVVIYAHHTNAEGYYRRSAGGADGSDSAGMIRGWVKTDAQGRYRFDTIKPAPYPSLTMPAHIHLYIAEPGRPPYYIDDVVFANEFKVDDTYRAAQELRGGSGIVALSETSEDALQAVRDIVLERHP